MVNDLQMWRDGEGKRVQGLNHPLLGVRQRPDLRRKAEPAFTRAALPAGDHFGSLGQVRPVQEFGTIEVRS